MNLWRYYTRNQNKFTTETVVSQALHYTYNSLKFDPVVNGAVIQWHVYTAEDYISTVGHTTSNCGQTTTISYQLKRSAFG